MNRDRLLMMLAATFAGLSVFVAMVAIVFQPVLLVLAIPFGVVTYFMWYQASGRLGRRIYRGVENRARTEEQGGFGAGPRGDYQPRSERFREPFRAGHPDDGRTRGQAPRKTDLPTEWEARDVLDVGPEADEDDVRRAYREKVKEVHPDTPDGDEERFKEVTAAYEQLAED